MAEQSLPDYEPMLKAYHQAFAPELEAMIRTLPIAEGSLVLEMACGDGAYTPWIAKLVGASGRVVGLDVSPSYLEVARTEVRHSRQSDVVTFVAGSIDRLPFSDQAFDAVWCAQSLFSLPEPVEAVTAMARLVKPGGLVAILEDDTLHQVLLPWPIEIELAVRAAEWDSLCHESRHPHKFYVGRNLVGVFKETGLVDIQVRAFASSRMAPLEGPIRTFLEAYLDDLRERVRDRIDPARKSEFLRLTDPGSTDAMFHQDDFHLTMIDHVIQGKVPSAG